MHGHPAPKRASHGENGAQIGARQLEGGGNLEPPREEYAQGPLGRGDLAAPVQEILR